MAVDADHSLVEAVHNLVEENQYVPPECLKLSDSEGRKICSIVSSIFLLQQNFPDIFIKNNSVNEQPQCEMNVQQMDLNANTMTTIQHMFTILDRFMEYHDPHSFMYGYIRPVQIVDMLKEVTRLNAKTYCEVGFNGGHSAVTMLAAFPDIEVYSFDLGIFQYSAPIVQFLEIMYPQRFHFIKGFSNETIPQYAPHVLKGKCDLIFIDGSHDEVDVWTDILNLGAAAAPSHVVFLDDTQTMDASEYIDSFSSGYCLYKNVTFETAYVR